jgi:hypothetical protein
MTGKGVYVLWHSPYILFSLYRGDVCFEKDLLVKCVLVINVCALIRIPYYNNYSMVTTRLHKRPCRE